MCNHIMHTDNPCDHVADLIKQTSWNRTTNDHNLTLSQLSQRKSLTTRSYDPIF